MDPEPATSPQKLTTYTPQSDPSKYIRTFAKDVAALTQQNAGAPTITAAPTPPVPQPDSDRDAAALGVSLPDFDPSPVNYSDPASPKEFKQESLELSTADSDGIFKGAVTSPEPATTMPAVGKDLGLSASAPVAQAENLNTKREDILARLRSKIQAQPQSIEPLPLENNEPEPVLPSAPVQAAPETLTVEPLRTAAPDFSQFDLSWIPKPPEPVSEAAAPANVSAPTQQSPSPIHTFSSDFAEKIDEQKSSTFAVLAAQSDAGQTPRPVAPARRAMLPLFAGVAMLVIGIAAIIGAYVFMSQKTTVPMVANVPSAITFDEAIEVRGTGDELMRAIESVAQGGGVTGNIVVTYVTGTSETDGSSIPQPGAALLKRLGLQAPSILLRNIQDLSTVGVVKAGQETRPFIILKVNSYERTFAGMLAWERSLPRELETWYPEYSSLPIDTTGTSSPVIALQANNGFEDAVVANYDVRILRDTSGRSLMLYGYKGKETLIIARDEAAFTALVARLAASGQ